MVKKEKDIFTVISKNQIKHNLEQFIVNHRSRYCREKGDPERVENKKNDNLETPLFYACKNGYYEEVKILLDKGADPLITSTVNNFTPLYAACFWRYKEIVELFLNNYKFSKSELIKCYKISNNNIKLILNNHIKLPNNSCLAWVYLFIFYK